MRASTRNFSLAIIAAVLFHVMLLAQTLVTRELGRVDEQPLTITLFEENNEPEPEPEPELKTEPENAEVLPDAIQPQTALTPLLSDKLIIATKPNKETVPSVVIQTSPQSTVFKNWLKSETESFTSQNPDAVGEFDHTFTPPPVYQSPKELSAANPLPADFRGRGAFMTEDNGKRTCYAEIYDLLDVSKSPSYVAKDCTPKKKFDLKLNQPNNGWTDR